MISVDWRDPTEDSRDWASCEVDMVRQDVSVRRGANESRFRLKISGPVAFVLSGDTAVYL